MRVCSFGNPRIRATAHAANAGNTRRLNALIAYTPWALSKEAQAPTNLSRLHQPLKRVVAIECAPLVTYFAVQHLHDGSCSDATEIQAAHRTGRGCAVPRRLQRSTRMVIEKLREGYSSVSR